ncbi:PpiC-type peptidyl-prolyl cis-trans isomerase [Paenibacillus algicola]|uniref:peptidylprolyl isomerase n=1 Tax=Paenibacillus algicola TaxID=2565926 RepID=A0A4P8XLI5_9BACL|nr:peptidyl-prolyl cis-trans isomerase [Paenibacillus algicola]QCT03348.1 PpiC-type peptidyl-prolyl cis-trans isomerase [Paenibacillus algicola]
MKENESQSSLGGQNEENLEQEQKPVSSVEEQELHEVRRAEADGSQEAISSQPVQEEARAGGNGGGGKGWMVASIVLAAALIVVLIVRPFEKDTSSEPVASVNNVAITKQDLYDSLVEAGGEMTLDSLITEEIINQEVAKQSIEVTDAEVTAEIESLKSMFKSEEEFNNVLMQNGLTLDILKEQSMEQLKMKKLLGDKINVTEDEVKQMFDQVKDNFSSPEQVRASHILVETEEEAKAVIKQLDEGADFAAIAAEKNEDATKDKGGDLGFFQEVGQMDPAFSEAAFKLEKGTYSKEPVESSFGFHIILVTDRTEAVNPTLEDKQEALRTQLETSQAMQQSETYIQELKGKAKITNTLEKAEEPAAEESPAAEQPSDSTK